MASGAFFPGVLSWTAFDGAYTLSSDYETITASSGELRSPSVYTASVAKISWSSAGTVTNFQARSSAAAFQTRDDKAMLLPLDSEWDAKFDGAANISPTGASYGFTETVGGSGSSITPSANGFRLQTTSTSTRYYLKSGVMSTADRHGVMLARIKIGSTHTAVQQIWCGFPHAASRNAWILHFAGSGGGLNSWRISGQGSVYYPGFTITADQIFDVRVDTWMDATTVLEAKTYVRVAGSYPLRSLEGWTELGGCTLASDSNRIIFGNANANGVTDVTWYEVLWFGGAEWETITNNQTSFTQLDRGYTQVKFTLDGNMTELDLMNSLAAPNNPADPEIKNIGDDGISLYVPSSVASAAAYEFKLRDSNDDLIDSQIVWNKGWTFSTVPTGTYYGEIYACSDDGVRSVSGAVTSTITVPETATSGYVAITIDDNSIGQNEVSSLTLAITGSVITTLNGLGVVAGTSGIVTGSVDPIATVDLDISDSLIGAGETSDLAYVVSGNVSVTLNNATISGSGSETVVTGSSSVTTPPNQPTSINVVSAPNRPLYIGVL